LVTEQDLPESFRVAAETEEPEVKGFEGCEGVTGTIEGVEVAVSHEPLDLDPDLTLLADEDFGVDLRLSIEDFAVPLVIGEHLVVVRRVRS
jgi:hypothetical protein